MNLFEVQILEWIRVNLRVPSLNGIVAAISALGNEGIFWTLLAVLLIAFKKTRKLGICCTGSVVITFLLVNVILKPLVARVRPYDLEGYAELLLEHVKREHDFSFPSGHASNGLACAWVLFRMTKKQLGIPALVLAVFIALSRLYVGVHYPSDVLVGVIIGIVCAEISVRYMPGHFNRALEKSRSKKNNA